MSSTSRRSTERFKYGVCLNDECPKCKSKEVLQIPMRKDLVCPECGKELRECPAPKKTDPKPFIYGGAAVAGIAAIIGLFAAFSGGDSDPVLEPIDSLTVVEEPDSIIEEMVDTAAEAALKNAQAEADKAKAEAEKAKAEAEKAKAEAEAAKANASKPAPSPAPAPVSKSGSVKLSYGTYVGATKNGYPHGQGRLTYSKARQINRNDGKARMANPGDQIVGEFFNGFFINGKHLDANGNIIESVMIGVGDESAYESK